MVLDKATGELVECSTGGSESDYRPGRWKHFREDYRFTGREEDVEVGLIYFGKRFLKPLLNRWVSADPLAVHGLGADPNLYAYVSGRVVQSVDPLSLQEEATLTGPIYRPGSNGRTRTDKNAGSNDSYSAWRGSCGADCEAAADAGWLAGDQQRQEIPITNAAEFPEIKNAVQYVERARESMTSPPPGTLSKVRSKDGATVFYHKPSNTFAIRRADGVPQTMFKPDPAKHGYSSNLAYYNAQF